MPGPASMFTASRRLIRPRRKGNAAQSGEICGYSRKNPGYSQRPGRGKKISTFSEQPFEHLCVKYIFYAIFITHLLRVLTPYPAPVGEQAFGPGYPLQYPKTKTPNLIPRQLVGLLAYPYTYRNTHIFYFDGTMSI